MIQYTQTNDRNPQTYNTHRHTLETYRHTIHTDTHQKFTDIHDKIHSTHRLTLETQRHTIHSDKHQKPTDIQYTDRHFFSNQRFWHKMIFLSFQFLICFLHISNFCTRNIAHFTLVFAHYNLKTIHLILNTNYFSHYILI